MTHPFRHRHKLCDACVDYELALEEVEALRAWLEERQQADDQVTITETLLRLPVVPPGATLARRRRAGLFAHLHDLPLDEAGARRIDELLGKKKGQTG